MLSAQFGHLRCFPEQRICHLDAKVRTVIRSEHVREPFQPISLLFAKLQGRQRKLQLFLEAQSLFG